MMEVYGSMNMLHAGNRSKRAWPNSMVEHVNTAKLLQNIIKLPDNCIQLLCLAMFGTSQFKRLE